MRTSSVRFAVVLAVAGAFVLSPVAGAQESSGRRGWGWGFQLGAMTGTVDGTQMSVALLAENYRSPAFSWGGTFFFTPLGDLTAAGGAVVLRFHVVRNRWEIVPTVGMGLIRADLDGNSDTGFFLPLGVEGAVEVSPNIFLTTSVTYNLHQLTFDEPAGDDSASTTFSVGVRYFP